MLLRKRKWQPTPVFLPGEFHGQGSLVGYGPQDHKESYMTGPTAHTVLLWSRRISSYKWLLPASLPSGGGPVAFLLTRKFSKISRYVWPRLLSKETCLCTGTQNTCDFACGPLRTKCLFLMALWLSQAPLVLKPDILRAYSWFRTPGLRNPMWNLNTWPLGAHLYNYGISPFCSLLIWGVGY